jgi:peptidoglycan/xylan/chitin deacetylase (PgdA/CDA1 family)
MLIIRRYFNLCGGFSLLILLLLGAGLVCPAQGAQPVTIWAGDSSSPKVALTFDDGPSPRYTPEILALLKHYQARATFFVLGCKVERFPRLIRAMLKGGHEVGNHSFSHPRLTKSDQQAREMELERTRVDLDLLGCPPDQRLMRPPYSAFDDRLVSYLAHTHRQLVLWSIDSGDWQGLDAGAIVKNVLNRVRNGAIIIFHDSDEKGRANRKATVEALKVILPGLRAAGYRMVTVSELLAPRKLLAK